MGRHSHLHLHHRLLHRHLHYPRLLHLTSPLLVPRQAKPIEAFDHERRRRNAQLSEKKLATLSEEEFVGARLYTGPMFIKYNAVLRDWVTPQTPRLTARVPLFRYNAVLRGHASKNAKMQENLEHLCKSNRYITTLHVINSSIVKLGKLTEATKVYRGVSSGVLPPKFWEKDEYGIKAARLGHAPNPTPHTHIPLLQVRHQGRRRDLIHVVHRRPLGRA